MRPLRIRFFTNFVHEQGTYFRFHNLARALNRLGQQVEIYGLDHDTCSRRRREVRDGIPYHVVPSARGLSLISPLVHPLNLIRLRRQVDPAPCDVAHLFQPFPAAFAAWRACDAAVKIYDWDDLWAGGLMAGQAKSFRGWSEHAMTKYFEATLPAAADHVTICGGFLRELALARGAPQATVIHNGLWPLPPAEKAAARRTLGLEAGARYVGFMGRTCDELAWIFEAMRANYECWPELRLALCGPPSGCLDGLDASLRGRIDYLGQLTPEQTRDFAAALDLGLLPLADTPFNRSRFPIKFAEYMAAGAPVLCSEIGECGRLAENFSWVLKAGTTVAGWQRAFADALVRMGGGGLPAVDAGSVNAAFSWQKIAVGLLEVYQLQVNRRAALGCV
jgi:glycosyltransferase involved in cell wall biosynthesis